MLSDHHDVESDGSSVFEFGLGNAAWNLCDWDLLIIVADQAPSSVIELEIRQKIQRFYKYGTTHIMAIRAGIYWLAESNLLSHQIVALHWADMDTFKPRYPDLNVIPQLFHCSDRITTCAGQAASLDCTIHYLEHHETPESIAEVVDLLCLDRLRSGEEKQRLPSRILGGDVQPRLTMALELMENNIEEALSTEEIARLVHISRRQLERLFKQFLGTMPAKYYLQLRLERAKLLLSTTNTSIVQVGLSCGFSSGPHFSASYRSFYDITPREERANRIIKPMIKSKNI